MTGIASTAHLPRVRARRRGDHEIQLGVSEEQAAILSGLSPAETRAILGLGPLTALQWGHATSTKPPSARWDQVVDLLGRAARGVAQHYAPSGTVVVVGTGSVADAVTDVLSAISSRVITRPHDVHRLERGEGPVEPVDLVVLPSQDALPPHLYAGWQRHGIPHLPVVVSATRLVVGPLVRPGGHGPCLRCLDLHRTARDPHWPDLVAQLESSGPRPEDVSTSPELAAMAAGLVGLTARSLLVGRPLPAGVALSVASPQPRVQHHAWTPHPECSCRRVDPADTHGAAPTT